MSQKQHAALLLLQYFDHIHIPDTRTQYLLNQNMKNIMTEKVPVFQFLTQI
jgi:hypothetical protein